MATSRRFVQITDKGNSMSNHPETNQPETKVSGICLTFHHSKVLMK